MVSEWNQLFFSSSISSDKCHQKMLLELLNASLSSPCLERTNEILSSYVMYLICGSKTDSAEVDLDYSEDNKVSWKFFVFSLGRNTQF